MQPLFCITEQQKIVPGLAVVMMLLGGPSLADSVSSPPEQPDLSAKTAFVAAPASGNAYKPGEKDKKGHEIYEVYVSGDRRQVELYDYAHLYDYAGNPKINPFFDTTQSAAGVSDVAYIVAWDPAGYLTSGLNIFPDGKAVPGHVEWSPASGRLMLASLATDQISNSGRCRSQIASYGVPSLKKYYWDLSVQFGENTLSRKWALTNPGSSPVLITQLKAPDAQDPALGVYVDTDSENTSKLRLYFSQRGANDVTVNNVGYVAGLQPNAPVKIVMEAFLDERETKVGGLGYWRAWVNGKFVFHYTGPTLTAGVTSAHEWTLDAFLFNDTCPSGLNRYVFFNRARLLNN